MKDEQPISLTHRELVKIHSDPKKSARAVDLRFVKDSEPGITRIKYSRISSKANRLRTNLKLNVSGNWFYLRPGQKCGSAHTLMGICKPPDSMYSVVNNISITRCGKLCGMKQNFIAWLSLEKRSQLCERELKRIFVVRN
jgi:hypothetical protein